MMTLPWLADADLFKNVSLEIVQDNAMVHISLTTKNNNNNHRRNNKNQKEVVCVDAPPSPPVRKPDRYFAAPLLSTCRWEANSPALKSKARPLCSSASWNNASPPRRLRNRNEDSLLSQQTLPFKSKRFSSTTSLSPPLVESRPEDDKCDNDRETKRAIMQKQAFQKMAVFLYSLDCCELLSDDEQDEKEEEDCSSDYENSFRTNYNNDFIRQQQQQQQLQ